MSTRPRSRWLRVEVAATLVLLFAPIAGADEIHDEVQRLVGALLSETPLSSDLQDLTDRVGGRPTGSAANRAGAEWGVQRFREAGVAVHEESFQVPALWLSGSAEARVGGDAAFSPRVVAMPFSTPASKLTGELVDAGTGSDADFGRLGLAARGAFVLVETEVLTDVDGLFREYAEAAATEKRAFAAGVGGVVYMASRPHGLLYRHNASLGFANDRPMLVMEREQAQRALRLLRGGAHLTLTVTIDVQSGGPYAASNVIAEIPGRSRPDEVVLIGAHLDSWDLGTGALDNGCNAALVVDVARQMKALGLRPRRTVRFALWNGEEQMMLGSWAYARDHESELDAHVMAAAIDIGAGRITGFFTGGRPELVPFVDAALAPVAALGPFVQADEPVVGTDNYDFMMEGVANLVANQAPASYGPNYHARSDTFDKVDVDQVRRNAAIVAALTWAFAERDVGWERQTRPQIEAIVEGTSLRAQMEMFGLYAPWLDGTRGRRVTMGR